MSDNIPHVTVKRFEPNRTYSGKHLTFIDCPHCGREHMHGDGPGHRVAHCSGASLPNPGNGSAPGLVDTRG